MNTVMYISLFVLFLGRASSLKICSFNIRSFGEKKMSKPEVVEVIVECISRCDIMLVMEIKDVKGEAFTQLMSSLNSRYSGRIPPYNYVISERLGRKSYKEQYAFIYRQRSVSVQSVYQYPDTQPGDEDVFAREPLIVRFSSPATDVKDLIIIPIHTSPGDAVKEVDELYDVYQDVLQQWKAEDLIIMGDFNAACGYVPKRGWGSIRLRSDPSFLWLIDDTTDTTVKESTRCAYDRVVLHGERMIQAVRPGSVEVFDFRQAYGLTEQQALAVSDHFPVCITVTSSRRVRKRG